MVAMDREAPAEAVVCVAQMRRYGPLDTFTKAK